MKTCRHLGVMRRQRGLSLIELLIALVLGLAVLGGLASVYAAVKQTFRFQETTGRLQEDAAFALDSIAKDLRMAGYAGCAGIDKVTVATVTTYTPGNMVKSTVANVIDGPNPLAVVESGVAEVVAQPFTAFNVIRGFDSVPSLMFATGAAPTSSGTDSLFFAAASSKAVSLNAAMTAANSAPALATDTYGWRNAPGGTYNMLVSNCTSSTLFKGKVTYSAGAASVAHDTSLDNTADTFASSALYGVDAQVMPVEWNFFYVATRTGAITPSLYRIYFDGNQRSSAEEVVSNVESLKLHYGENTSVDAAGLPTWVADTWRLKAADVTDWSRVVAVRVGLMMVSSEDNTSPDVTLTVPKLLGQTYTKPAGSSPNRLRKEYSTTVVLRNRVTAR